jgi:hypothetical protein
MLDDSCFHYAASPARWPRHAFRTVLRIAEAVPPVKRRMFNTAHA